MGFWDDIQSRDRYGLSRSRGVALNAPTQETKPTFWDQLGPGLFGLGGNILEQRFLSRDEAKRQERARGPLYGQQLALAGRELAGAGAVSPEERLAKITALMAPGEEAARQQLMRELQKQGMLDVSSFMPIPGTTPTPGVAMNPQLAALYAAQAGAREKAAYDAIRGAEDQRTRQVQRAGMLSGEARAGLESGLRTTPVKKSLATQLISGGMGLLQQPKVAGTIWDQLKKLPGLFGIGGTGATPPIAPTFQMPTFPSYTPTDFGNIWDF